MDPSQYSKPSCSLNVGPSLKLRTFVLPTLLPYGYSYIWVHPMPDQVKSSFVIFDIRALWRWASECPDVKNYKWRLDPVWHRMLCSCTHMATVGVRGLTQVLSVQWTGPSLLMTTAYVYAITRPSINWPGIVNRYRLSDLRRLMSSASPPPLSGI